MKRAVLTISLLTQLIGCQVRNDESFVNKFITDAVLNPAFKIESVSDYVLFTNDTSSEESSLQFLKLNMDEIRKSLEACNNNYQIIQHNRITPDVLGKYVLDYSDHRSIYYIVCDSKVLTHVILKNGKVISFFTKLKKADSQQYKPWILNQ